MKNSCTHNTEQCENAKTHNFLIWKIDDFGLLQFSIIGAVYFILYNIWIYSFFAALVFSL